MYNTVRYIEGDLPNTFSSYFMLSGNAQEVNKRDTTVEMKEVMVTARSEIRKLKESAMPISVIRTASVTRYSDKY